MFQPKVIRAISLVFATILIGAGLAFWLYPSDSSSESEALALLSEGLDAPSKAARTAYFFNMLRDPATNKIPPAIRSRELKYADQLYQSARFASKRKTYHWFEAGPYDVGGRTRALAIDLNNSNRLLAGGVSGGLWESEDRGATWQDIEINTGNFSVTSIAQDPRPGKTNIWYYASGEYAGNSASDAARNAPYYGSGIYKSTDNGNSWFLLPAGNAGDEASFDSPFDFVNKVAISPATGSVFVAANAVGVFRSVNGGDTFGTIPQGERYPDPVLGGVNDHFWSDVAVNRNGAVLVTLSSTGSNNRTNNEPGVYLSLNDGVNWMNMTPTSFPFNHGRSVVAFAPSNPDLAYIFTTTQNVTNNLEDVRLHKINISSGASEDLSNNLTRLSDAGNIDTQGGYNMAIAVRPDDENFVLLGATNVYRSRNGFSSGVVERLDYWIGGYDAVDDDFGNYENHHPDQHLFVFDPKDPGRVWTANDGGIYMTTNVSRQNEVTWFDMNQGYNTTQFYTVAIHANADDPRIAGGAQDNGTPFLRFNDLSNTSRNISVGDGAHLYLGTTYAFVGFQNGSTLRLQYNDDGTPTFAGFSYIQPKQATNQLFINPFVVDPNNENVMYYAADNAVWRNNTLADIRSGQTDSDGVTDGWSRLDDIPRISAHTISAMTISHSPANILYYGASDTRAVSSQTPLIYRMPNADKVTGNGTQTFSIAGASPGAYVADIALHPNNANELLVVLSNYDVVGLFHSLNGGQSFSAVEGNLEGSIGLPGPSLRAATIVSDGNETMYFVGSSTGLFSTTSLNGAGTVWTPEGAEEVGQAVVWDVTSRQSDQVVAIGTHGRGLYVGSQDPDFNPRPLPDLYSLSQNYPNPFASITRIAYNLPQRSLVTLDVYDLSGRKVTNLVANQEKETGRHEAVFNAASVTSGVYLFQLVVNPVSGSEGAASFSQTRKMMVIK